MGRIKSPHPRGNFVIRNKKPNDKGEVVVYLQYSINSEVAPKTTKVWIKPDDWDKKRQEVKGKHPSSARLNNQLKDFKERVDKLISAHEGVLTIDVLRQMLSGEYAPAIDAKKIDFIEYAHSYNQSCYESEKIAYSTFYNAQKYIDQFHRFLADECNQSSIYISELRIELFDKYKNWRIKKGNKKQGINKMLTPLFKAVKYASDNELISQKVASTIVSNYFELKERSYKSEVEDGVVHYLTYEQMQQFVNLQPFVKHNRTREIMDMFLFSFHACGLRFSDILTLEWSHIDWDKKELSKNLFKGKIPHSVPLSDPAMDILAMWQKKGYNDRFVFDLLPRSFDLKQESELNSKRNSKNRTLQTSLTAVGQKIVPELPFNLTMHVARHTFAVMALERKVTIHLISKLLGHSSIVTTEQVYAEFLPDTITQEVRENLSFSFTPQS